MNLKAGWAIALVSLALVPAADAMSIHDFGRMNDDDEASFVALLVEGAAHMFKVQGRPDEARALIAFFKTPGQAGGTFRLADQLKLAYALNLKNGTNPNNRVPDRQVEDAMAATLRAEGFNVPAGYLLGVGEGFRPIGPPRALPTGQGEFH